eukprot:TRINITY_DN107153_c0_g2_i2.p1 TRINITY_DN107153_c0_g2~~TRINITY_DN107153_c0_g2_i2.p1  ORF type:complete len:562 (+),score=64.71 TRINITY_DN107153_c0_g2_i2:66-1751(+)
MYATISGCFYTIEGVFWTMYTQLLHNLSFNKVNFRRQDYLRKRGFIVKAQEQEVDVVVIGSGVGGLSCAALLAKYGVNVCVCESHSIAGGAAHAWVRDGYHFESGPSLYSGMNSRGVDGNPISHVFQAIGEELDLLEYREWRVIVPEGEFHEVGLQSFQDVLQKFRGAQAVKEWQQLQESMVPLRKAATVFPAVAVRYDPAVILTLAKYLGGMLTTGVNPLTLLGPFSKVIENQINDEFIKNWLDLLCFLLSGLPADGTITAEVAFMFNEWYKPGAKLEFPKGGSQAMINALIRGLKKFGGKIKLNAHVDEILIEGGRAQGVRLRNGDKIRARKAVVTNASIWDSVKLLPVQLRAQDWVQQVNQIPTNRSFMHLHVGFDATGLEDVDLHTIVVNSWEGGVDTEQNVVLISIASAIDSSLAPEGKHVLHAYLPATEPYSIWKNLDKSSAKYAELKEKRSQVLWKAVERVIPDIRERVEISMVGTPLTHQHFLRRHEGTYGPGIKAGQGQFPNPITPIPGLYACGDSVFPGIGLPAVAASGANTAATLVPVWDHLQMLEEIGV